MKKILLTLFVLTSTVITCSAQHINSFGLIGEGGVPTGSAKDLYSYTAGFGVVVESPSKIKPLKFIASIGFTDFVVKTGLKTITEADYLPIQIGAKYYIHKFFVEGTVGEDLDLNGNKPTQPSGFMYSPSLGYTVQGLDFDQIDFGLTYLGNFRSDGPLSRVAFRLVYRFDL